MANTKTLLEMRTELRKRADAVGDTTTGRHTTSQLNVMLNNSWQAMRAIASQNTQIYLKPAVATMTAGKTSPYSWGTVSLPADCVRIYGFDCTVAANDVRTLLPGSFSERNEYVGIYGQGTGIPAIFFPYNVGVEVTTTVSPGVVGILPAPATAYPYTLWYLPKWTAITDDTYVFDGIEGWDEWVIEDCVVKLAESDNDMGQTAQIAMARQEKAEIRLRSSGASFAQAGPIRRLDVAGMRRNNVHDVYRRRP
jgi:hypothetical protein